MSDDDDTKTPIDQALDVFVYLPIGFMLEFPRSIPRYIERGRRQFDAAKRIGRESLPTGTPAQQFDRLQAQTRNTLRALGVVPTDGPAGAWSTHSTHSTTANRPARLSSSAGLRPAPNGAEPSPESTATSTEPADPGIDSTTLAIPDYDSLSASQVVPRLDSLALDELELVRQYENAKRGRKTILSKIAQLQAG